MDYRSVNWEALYKKTHSVLFRCLDGSSISFYFHINNKNVKKNLERLVKKGGGEPVDEFVNMSPVTALMVDDMSDSKRLDRVSFKASFIIDSVNERIIRNINDYIHCDIPKPKKKINYMNIIFFRMGSFLNENNEQEDGAKGPSNEDSSDDVDRVFPPTQQKGIRCKSYNPKRVKYKSGGQRNTLFDSDSDMTGDRNCSVQSVVEQKCLNPCVHCPFYKHHQVQTDEVATSSGLVCREDTVDSNADNNVLIIRNSHNKSTVMKKDTITRTKEIEPVSSDSDTSCNVSVSRICSDESDGDCHNGPNIIQMKHSNNVILSEDEDDIGPPARQQIKSTDKHTRLPYSRREKEAILHYIIKKNAFDFVNGTTIWKQIERSNICPQRSWMSLENHFRRHLRHELSNFPFLTENQINALKP